ncbi:MAG: cupin domain-containing protein, partial [Hyphomicrobiaceae bacterium]
MTALSADDAIRLLELQPHHERGYYRETFRDPRGSGGRAASGAIYYLLAKDEISRWHRVDAAEIWHWYAGAALLLSVAPSGGIAMHLRLGPDLATGERPQVVIPK